MKQFIDSKNMSRQECEACGRLYNFSDLRLTATVDGELLLCNNCYNQILRSVKYQKKSSDERKE